MNKIQVQEEYNNIVANGLTFADVESLGDYLDTLYWYEREEANDTVSIQQYTNEVWALIQQQQNKRYHCLLLRILGAVCAGVWGCVGVSGYERILPEPSHRHSPEPSHRHSPRNLELSSNDYL